MKLKKILQENFKLEDFREGQRDVIESVASGNDTMVFMPTGGGKSLTYQIPGLALDGIAIIVSPLISLMKDQVDKLNDLGIEARLINSTISHPEQQQVLENLDKIKFLYIAPERLNSPSFLNTIKSTKIALIAMDEAHCISQWGHDFRPSYMKVKGFIEKLRSSPPLTPPPSGEGDKNEEFNRKSNILQNYFESPNYLKDIVLRLRKNQTETENILWEILRGKKLEGLKFRRQHPFGRYVADFYCSKLKLVIELDGEIHNNTKDYDKVREDIIKKYGVRIIRFKNEEIINNIEDVIEKILNFLSPEGGKYPRNEGDRGINSFPIIALTATATLKVKKDIIERLGLEKYKMFTAGFDRKNIIILVREISKVEEKMGKVMEIINNTKGSGIIYCSSRKNVDEVYNFLKINNVKAGMYTGAMNPDLREEVQNGFMNDDLKVIVATNAFGMGIDKKDIRFVIHYNLPGSIENYYQEVGRAGRDGKKSFGVILASYGDTKIQEFFIENSNPSKAEILEFYDFLYKDYKTGEGKGDVILKTYKQLAQESGMDNDMKVGSIIKILEKYGILKRGYEGESEQGFRGRGMTINQEKRNHSGILIDWKHQELLKDEAYYKLDQIKKLLFYPSCRKRFILEYFGDEEDLKDLPENCGVCDYCIDKKKFDSGDFKDLVPLSVFEMVIETVKKFDKRFGAAIIARFLCGSRDKRILEWNMDKNPNYGILSTYDKSLISGVIDTLNKYDFIEKTTGKFPVIGLTDKGSVSIKREYILKDEQVELQAYLNMYCKNKNIKKYKTKTPNPLSGALKGGFSNTYKETLNLYKSGKSIDEIVEIRNLKAITIEGHLLKFYDDGDFTLMDILKIVDFDNVKIVKKIIEGNFSNGYGGLREIKDKCEELGHEKISYFDIKACISMIDKGDL